MIKMVKKAEVKKANVEVKAVATEEAEKIEEEIEEGDD